MQVTQGSAICIYMNIQQLFFELIQVALGVRICLSRTPDDMEWKALYDMAKKQSLVGVCFAGLQRLSSIEDSITHKPYTINLPEVLYLTWMGMAAKIQQRNEVVNRQCAELGERLKAEGYSYCILKGQGVATLYNENLQSLRQSGDIDALLWKAGLSHKANREAVMQLARKYDKNASGAEHHVHVKFFEDTEVELHYEPSYFCNPWANRRFRRWCEEHRKDMVKCEALGSMVPNAEYNLVFLLSHTFRHYVSEGVGLRQVMDYFFVLSTRKNDNDTLRYDNDNLLRVLKSLNMLKFAGAMMWVLQTVFGMEHEMMICEPNERLGRKLLTHIMQGGNFGHHNTETVASKESHVGRFINQLTLDLSLAMDYTSEALWSPISMIREFLRIRF